MGNIKININRISHRSPGEKEKKRKHKWGLHIWNEEIATLIKNKNGTYLRYLNSSSIEGNIEYKRLSAVVKRKYDVLSVKVGRHLSAELNTMYMDVRQKHIKY
jgi:hypothetical protein